MSRWVSYSTGGNFSVSNSYLRMPTITNICSYTNNSNLVITKNTNIISGLVSNINSSFDTFINNKLNDQINFSLKIIWVLSISGFKYLNFLTFGDIARVTK